MLCVASIVPADVVTISDIDVVDVAEIVLIVGTPFE